MVRFGDQEIEVGAVDAEQTVRLTKFVAKVWNEVQEDQQAALLDGFEKGNWASFLNVLSVQHLYELTAILLKISKKTAQENWTLSKFTEILAELSEKEDLSVLLKNLQRVAAAFQS